MIWAPIVHGDTHVFVAIGRQGSEETVDDARAVAISIDSRRSPAFVRSRTPHLVAEKYPGARVWHALPGYLVDVMRKLWTCVPAYVEPALDVPLITARRHLPEDLPVGWSAPVAHRPNALSA
jgi:hypothetical protein